jgi:hypothetical protein
MSSLFDMNKYIRHSSDKHNIHHFKLYYLLHYLSNMYITHYSSIMESSLPQHILYDTTTKCLTEAGELHIHSYFMDIPFPSDDQLIQIVQYTGCPVSTLKVS